MKWIAFHLTRATRVALVSLLILLAIVFTVARMLLPEVNSWREQLVDTLSSALDARVELGQLSGRFHDYNPALRIDNLQVYPKGSEAAALDINQIIFELDTISSLASWEPVFRRVLVRNGAVSLTGAPGAVHLTGFEPLSDEENTGNSASGSQASLRQFMAILNEQRRIDLDNVHLSVALPSGVTHTITLDRLAFNGAAAERRMSARLIAPTGETIKLAANTKGRAQDWPDVSVNGYVSVPPLDFDPWLELLPESLQAEVGLRINTFEAGLETWFSYKPSGWDFRGNAVARKVSADWQGKVVPELENFQTRFNLTFGKEQPERLWLHDLDFTFADYPFNRGDLYLERRQKPEASLLVASKTLDLQPLALMAKASGLLPELGEELVTRLAPRGQLENFVIRLYPEREQFDLDIAAGLQNVGVDHWFGAPSGERINGKLRMNALTGTLDVDSPGFTLGLDNVFENVWVYDRVKGQLYWHITDNSYVLRTDNLSFNGGEGDLEARLRLDIPFDERPVYMALEAGIRNGDVSYTGKYLPVRGAMSDELADWLNSAIKLGDVEQGAFIWDGPLAEVEIPHSISWGLFFNVNNASIAYSPDWPELTQLQGVVNVSQSDVDIIADSARVYNSRISSLRARIPDLTTDKPLFLMIAGKALSHGPDGERLLTETPIAFAMEHAADNWKITGTLPVDLNLKIPLEKGTEDVRVDINLQDNSLTIPDAALTASALKGILRYSTAKGLHSKSITGELFGKPVSAVISGGSKTRIDASGRIDMLALGQWLDFDVQKLAQGETDYVAKVSFPAGSKGVRVNVNSSLPGIHISLPAPLGKSGQATKKLSLQVDAGSKQIKLKGMLGESLLQTQLVYQDASFVNGRVHFGSGLSALPEKGLLVSGQLDTLKLDTWHEWWNSYSQSSQSDLPRSKQTAQSDDRHTGPEFQDIHVQDVRIGKLTYGATTVKDAVVGVVRKPSETEIQLQTSAIKAVLGIADKPGPLKLLISELRLPESVLPGRAREEAGAGTSAHNSRAENEQDKPDKTTPDPLAKLDPTTIPEMDIRIDRILAGKEEFGHLKLQLRKIPDGLTARNITGKLGHAELNGSVNWHYHNRAHKTELKLHIDSNEVEKLFSSWGFAGLITAKQLNGDASVYWSGSPAGFDIDSLDGQMSFAIADGRFTSFDATSPTSALRLFGVLNLDSITRRLRLDFTDLFSSGIAFDRTRGVIGFNNGLITLTEPLTVKGPSSDFRLGGKLNVPERMLDMELVVTLPVAQNVSVISLLLGQPYIAGAAFVFDKLLGSSLDQFASIRYEITGDFGNPTVQLDRLFSNKVENQNKTKNRSSIKP